MHESEIAIDVSLVDELICAQFPHWHGLPLTRLDHGGTDHAIYRLGDELAVRLPRIARADDQAGKDAANLRLLGPHVPVEVPAPLALGEPTETYPCHWSVVRWLDGTTAPVAEVDRDTPYRLAEFVQALQQVKAAGLEWTTYRGRPDIEVRDDDVRESIRQLGDEPRFTKVWDEALAAPRWTAPGRWLHADLHEGNLLFKDGKLTGVIDWGCAGVGDPAGDLMVAWLYLDERGRTRFEQELDFDDATWARARGWALNLAVVALPYYRETNPFLADVARHTLGQLCPGWED